MTDPNARPPAHAHEEIVVTDDYAGPNRRTYVKTLEQLEEDVLRRFAEFEEQHRRMMREMRVELLSGFPDGDLQAHNEYHAARNKAAKAEEEFWKAARSEGLKYGVAGLFGILKWIAILTVLGLAYKVGLGPAVAKALGVAS